MNIDAQIIIKSILLDEDFIIINIENTNTKVDLVIESWIESKNKYNAHTLYLSIMNISNHKKSIFIKREVLLSFTKQFPQEWFKISFCMPNKRLNYYVSTHIQNFDVDGISIFVTENNLFFVFGVSVENHGLNTNNLVVTYYNNNKPIVDNNIKQLPIEILNIGSCFSRSIFRSDEYFNPTYRDFFHIKYTLFHNSFISLFSDKIDYDFSNIQDLTTGDASLYVEIEFLKNIDTLLKRNNFKLVVIDNYIDATSPIIKYNNNSYLTYNRYLAESIFKRFLSSCEIIYPGTKQYLDLYRESIIIFKNMLEKYQIDNIILIGGRLSRYKINEKTNHTDIWNDRMTWILNSNKNWDEVDKIFLEEIPSTIYIDKRTTIWKSDIFSPILGGASPSHYQSAYYKELFDDIISLLRLG